MASPVIKIKRSSVQNNAPTAAQLELGELALNTYDGKLFTEINDGTVSIVEIGGHLRHLEVSGITTLTGNVVVSGTVDGRDLATDGSKLDGIESGATADQTASEILTLLKTVDGGGSGLDADTLDGITSGNFLRSNTSDTMTGDLTLQGFSPDLNFVSTTNNPDWKVTNFEGSLIVYDITNSANKFVFKTDEFISLEVIDARAGIDVTGNITVSGTVDGRDIATDGTKLDTIESNATADQTASEILTLIKTVDGAGSGLDADTLDGVAGSSYLTTANYDTHVCHLKTDISTALAQGDSNEFTVNFNLEEHNDSSAFSHSSGVVTVLATGWYRVYANMVYENGTSSARNTIRAYIKKNGTEIESTRTYDYDRGRSYGRYSNNKIETMLYLSANDTIAVCNYAYNEDGTASIEAAECEFIVNSVSVATTTSNADTVDGLHASSFVRSDATDTVSGALTFTNDITLNGGTLTVGNYSFPSTIGAEDTVLKVDSGGNLVFGAGSSGGVIPTEKTFTATQGQTVFTDTSTLPTYIQVFVNGVKIRPTTDFSKSGSSITLVSAATVGDEIDLVRFD